MLLFWCWQHHLVKVSKVGGEMFFEGDRLDRICVSGIGVVDIEFRSGGGVNIVSYLSYVGLNTIV